MAAPLAVKSCYSFMSFSDGTLMNLQNYIGQDAESTSLKTYIRNRAESLEDIILNMERLDTAKFRTWSPHKNGLTPPQIARHGL